MKISIIIPYYNSEKWIARCLDSLLNQDIPKEEYEVLVVDDGSDHDVSILKSYADKYDNIRYLWQKNQRQGAARNHGIKESKGDYLFFCDSDDFVLQGRLGKLYETAVGNQLDVLFHCHSKVDFNGVIDDTHADFSNLKIWKNGYDFISDKEYGLINTEVWRFIVKREVIVENNLFFPTNMLMYEDSLFYLELMKQARKIGFVDVMFYYYITNPQSVMHNLGKKMNYNLYIDSILKYMSFMRENWKIFSKERRVATFVLDNIKDLVSFDSFIILHNMIRYGTYKENKDTIVKLRSISEYPVKYCKYPLLVAIMNNYRLWMTLCYIINIIPQKIRKKIF